MKTVRERLKKFFEDFYLVLVLIFLYAPILVMMVLSFNSSKSRSQWGGFTLQWYKQMFESASIMDALYNTLLIAFLSALIATILGTAAAIGISSMKKLPRTICMGLNNIPMLNSDIVTGISLMLMFIAFGISLGFKTILFAHITFNVPYVMLSVMPKLKQTSRNTYEAAMDLGAGPVKAFFKVVFPDILPGVLSGFLMAFTMSLDDFIITHFTKGAGINTLSTLIYSEVRRGIKPSMYALSTVIFVTVLALLLITNFAPAKPQAKAGAGSFGPNAAPDRGKKPAWTGKAAIVLASFLIVGSVAYTSYLHFSSSHSDDLYVYNWGEYIDESVIDEFEAETGIHVTYDLFETNEEMYPVIEAGGVNYDAVCPSDYMIQKMAENGLLAEINFDNVPNIKNIDQVYLEKSKAFDPDNRYSVPYTWGTVGIIYNVQKLEELGVPAPTKWSDLWDERLKGEILMQDSVRDAFMVALKELGYSMNTTDEKELKNAASALTDQKLLIQAYVMDEIFDKMAGGEAALAPYYAGDAITMIGDNPDLAYSVPREGTNLFVDAMCIPKGAKNKEAAEMYINFMCETKTALRNIEYIGYSTPQKDVPQYLDPELAESPISYPSDEVLENTEAFIALPNSTTKLIDQLWTSILSANETAPWTIPVFLIACLGLSISINVVRARKKKHGN